MSRKQVWGQFRPRGGIDPCQNTCRDVEAPIFASHSMHTLELICK